MIVQKEVVSKIIKNNCDRIKNLPIERTLIETIKVGYRDEPESIDTASLYALYRDGEFICKYIDYQYREQNATIIMTSEGEHFFSSIYEADHESITVTRTSVSKPQTKSTYTFTTQEFKDMFAVNSIEWESFKKIALSI